MKRLAAFVFLCDPCLLSAQQIVLPPSSVQDGVIIHTAGINAGSTYWSSLNSLGAYQIYGDGYQQPLHPGSTDQQLGLVWNTSAPATLSKDRQYLNTSGGIVRAIYVGETAGWLNDFGYTYSGNPSDSHSYTAWKKIQSVGPNPSIQFGDYFDVTLKPGEMTHFDFWFSATGVFGRRPTTLTDAGGVYTLFNTPECSNSSQFLWASNGIAANTWNPANSSSMLVNTYLVGVEDWRINRGADRDYNDLIFALQFLKTDGTAATAVIPEPSTWAIIAGLLALGYVTINRLRSRQHS